MRSSDSIAELAGALAKAQAELQNPPKSLIAYLQPGQDGSPGQAYRYAPLSARLEIVRKALGQHGLAILQTTEFDQGTATLMLTTIVAHSSGDWIASSWPVCGQAELAHPKLMGAALTYARRYSLFALVGLAGEDDLDAPELTARQGAPGIMAGRAAPLSGTNAPPPRQNGSAAAPGRLEQARAGSGDSPALPPAQPVPASAPPDLLGHLERVTSPDELMSWSISALPAANRLGAEERVELKAAFLARAKAVGADPQLLTALQPTRNRRGRARPSNPAGSPMEMNDAA